MSYNIDRFKLKELEQFSLPLESLFKSGRTDWHPRRVNHDDGSVSFEIGEGIVMSGVISGTTLYMHAFTCSGECSGYAMHEVFERAFAESSGRLVASCVWEGGDTINRLVVDNGKITWEPIDI